MAEMPVSQARHSERTAPGMIGGVAQLTIADCEALGVYDPRAPHAAQQLELLRYLADFAEGQSRMPSPWPSARRDSSRRASVGQASAARWACSTN